MAEEEKNRMETPETPDIETPDVETPDSPDIEGSTKGKNVFSRKLDNMKSRAKNNMNVKKQTFEKSAAGQFAKGIGEAHKAKGFKNKAKAFGKGTLNSAKASKAGQKLKKIKEKLQKMAQTIQKFLPVIQWVAIIVGAIVAAFNLAIFVYSFAQSFSSSPHYYCDINPADDVRRSALYKQYCTSTAREVDENGIPIVPFMMQTHNGWWDPDKDGGQGGWDHDYSQSKWPGTTSKMGPDSCGPSAACMILSYYTGQMFFPDSDLFVNGKITGYGPGGTHWQVQKDMAKRVSEMTGINITVETRTKFSIDELDEILANGDMAVLLMGPNTDDSIDCDPPPKQWTDGGHYIAVIGKLENGEYAVAESGGKGTRSYWGTTYISSGIKNTVEASALKNCIKDNTWNIFHSPENS